MFVHHLLFRDYFYLESLILKEQYKNLICNKAEGFVGFAYKQASRYSVKGDRLQTLEDIIQTITDLNLSKKTKIKEAYPILKEKFKDNYLVSFKTRKSLDLYPYYF